jgi:hypothetical protein
VLLISIYGEKIRFQGDPRLSLKSCGKEQKEYLMFSVQSVIILTYKLAPKSQIMVRGLRSIYLSA